MTVQFDPLAQLYELHRSCHRMSLDFSPLGPFVGGIMMPDVSEQYVRRCAMDDQAKIGIYAHRPEIRVLGLVKLVE
jgi:hypothetical protein